MSAYQTKIEKSLAKLSVALNPITLAKYKLGVSKGTIEEGLYGDQEFQPVRFYYATGKRDCDLCNHRNIKRVYVIKSRTSGKEAHIGCECAKNYIDASIVDGLAKIFDQEYKKATNPIKFEKEVEILKAIQNDPETLRVARYFRANLINGGSIRSILHKIEAGKNIGKREKQVIGFWTALYEHKETAAAFVALKQFFDFSEYAARQRYWKERDAAAAIGRFFLGVQRRAVMNEALAVVGVVDFLVGVHARTSGDVSALSDYDLLQLLYKADLNAGQKRFLNGVYRFFKNTGRVSPKQRACLEKYV